MKNDFHKFLNPFIVFIFFANLAYSENFRVRKLFPVEIVEDSSFEKTVVTGINDSVSLRLPENYEFIEGIEIKIQIPTSVSSWHDCVAFSLYDDVSPFPDEKRIDYSGTRIFLKPLPSKVYWTVQIPLSEENSLKDSAYTSKLNVIPDVSKGFVFVRFMPVMKGVPEETLEANLTLQIKPCLIDKGRLTILLDKSVGDSSFPCDIFFDDEILASDFSDSKFSSLISPGLHNLRIQSDNFRNEVRSVMIEKAKTSEVKVVLKSLTPHLLVSSPDGVEIFLDDEKFSDVGKEVEISEGEHRIRFVLGSYEVVRNITAQKGKTYTANFNVDLHISEE